MEMCNRLTYADEIFTVYEDIKKVTHSHWKRTLNGRRLSASSSYSIVLPFFISDPSNPLMTFIFLFSFLLAAFSTNLIFIRLMLRGALPKEKYESQMLTCECCVEI